MTDRRDEKGAAEQFEELFGTDAFLDDLSRGVDPTGGTDPLAELMLTLHHEVTAPMPPAPSLDDLLPEENPAVASLDAHRRHRVSPWMSGLVGAAAATMLIAGTGGAVYNASPGSPLWGTKTAVFGEHAAVVDLASALEEVDKRHSEGDVTGAMEVLEQARVLADAVNAQDRESTQRAIQALEARIVEVPTTVTESVSTTTVETSVSTSTETTTKEPTVPASPIFITETETVTVTVVPPVATGTPTPTPEPTHPTDGVTSPSATPTPKH